MKKFKKVTAVVLAVIAIISSVFVTAFAAPETHTIPNSLPNSSTPRELIIHKYSPIPAEGEHGDGNVTTIDNRFLPLENVEFEVYRVDDQFFAYSADSDEDENISAAALGVTPPTDENELQALINNSTHVGTYKTNDKGIATTGNALGTTNGRYLVIEKDNPAVAVKAVPFYVSVPYTNPDENAWIYNVNVYPKNDLKGGPSVDKDVTAVGTNHDTFDMNEEQTWIIKGTIPADLAYKDANGDYVTAKVYKFTDELDEQLSYAGSVSAEVCTADGSRITLSSTSYTTTEPSETAGGTFVFALTESGMEEIYDNLGEEMATAELRVYFNTVINESAELGKEIPNTVVLDYTNSIGKKFDPATVAEDEVPEVHTGGIVIDKYDAKTQAKLENATFAIYRDVKDNETANETIIVNGEAKDVVLVTFYNADGAPLTSVTTDQNGAAAMSGLAYGTYYVVETQAPDGYNLLSNPIVVTVNAESHHVGNEVKVANSAKFVLPITGGTGTLIFTLAGTVLIGLAAVVLTSNRKKKETLAD